MTNWKPLPGEQSDPRPLRESLERMARLVGAPGADALGVVFSRWTEVVGEAVADHCRPLSLTDGVLIVGVDEPGWATQLKLLSGVILRRLREALGPDVVGRLEVRVRRPR